MQLTRLITASAAAAATLAVAACGSGAGAPQASTAPGSPANPLQGQEQPTGIPSGKHRGAVAAAGTARSNEGAASGHAGAATGTPDANAGYQKLVEQQPRKPRHRFTPCSLVTQAQARAIVGGPVKTPLEGAQGPTCIYRTTHSAGFITVAVQHQEYPAMARQLRNRKRVTVGSRTAVCGSRGRPTVLVALSGGRVLNVAAPCEVGRRFALKAVQRLQG